MLWEQLFNGVFFNRHRFLRLQPRAEKTPGAGISQKCPTACQAWKTSLPVLYTSGVKGGKLTLHELVRLVCENPARIMGLYPRKGRAAAGGQTQT